MLARFLRYVRIDTQSDPNSNTYPSTVSQIKFIKLLSEELESLGAEDVKVDSYSYLTATIPASNGCEQEPVIGLISHVDTSADTTSYGVEPIIHNYDGGNIKLPHGIITMDKYPELKHFIGHTLITSDGTTLLGADDKAGVAIIISLAAALLSKDNDVSHGKIRLAFTPDEEIGRGTDFFDLEGFGADFAYTMDGSGIGLLEYENFHAAEAVIKATGDDMHPGYAYGKIKSAINRIFSFHKRLPIKEVPSKTKGREGFYHLTNIKGTINSAELRYIIRDFDKDDFEERKQFMNRTAIRLGLKVVITDEYSNMREFIPEDIIDRARQAIIEEGLVLKEHPIRGGTDGAKLSRLGLPCPNLFTGGMNFHSKHEYCSLEGMQMSLRVLKRLVAANKESKR